MPSNTMKLTLEYVKKHPEALSRFKNGVHIWSGEHYAWSGPDHRGWFTDISGAGVFTPEQAMLNAGHCCRKKKISFYGVKKFEVSPVKTECNNVSLVWTKYTSLNDIPLGKLVLFQVKSASAKTWLRGEFHTGTVGENGSGQRLSIIGGRFYYDYTILSWAVIDHFLPK